MAKAIHTGQVVIVKGGKYDGQGAQIKRIYDKSVAVKIAGRIVNLSRERVEHG